MTNNYKDYTKQQTVHKKAISTVEPLSHEEKADLKMRILLAVNERMA